MSRFVEAIAELERAQALDPLSLMTGAVTGWSYEYFARKYDQAIGQFRKVIEKENC